MVGCCPGEACSQEYSELVSAGCCATSGLRFSQDQLALLLQFCLLQCFSLMVRVVWPFGFVFWTALGAFGGGSPQSCPVVVLVVAALSLYRDDLSLLPVGLSV
ncbi:hypothetical protein Taro_017033 [Colocasia esculenta]|uniref:Uncharacterized protein n=1 Tax=Colocasia esculenta TaxID=4460 RepID=A0A843UF92_COLES|nr:hypothetical protein [Colocasia esculenta]